MSFPDVPTAVLCAMVTRSVLAMALGFYGTVQKTYRGFPQWTVGASLGAVGMLALTLRPAAPGASILLVNLLSAAGIMMLLDGTLRFVRDRSLDPRWYAVPCAIAAVNCGLYSLVDDLALRVWVFNLPVTAMTLAHAWVLLSGAPATSRVLYRVSAGLQLSYSVVLMLRALRWSVGPAPADLLQGGPAEAAFYLFLCAADLAGLTSFLMLNGARLEADLSASQGRLQEALGKLKASLDQVKLLTGMLPICSSCKKIRDAENHWHPVEDYVRARTDASFSHSVCPDCVLALYPEYADVLVDEM